IVDHSKAFADRIRRPFPASLRAIGVERLEISAHCTPLRTAFGQGCFVLVGHRALRLLCCHEASVLGQIRRFPRTVYRSVRCVPKRRPGFIDFGSMVRILFRRWYAAVPVGVVAAVLIAARLSSTDASAAAAVAFGVIGVIAMLCASLVAERVG